MLEPCAATAPTPPPRPGLPGPEIDGDRPRPPLPARAVRRRRGPDRHRPLPRDRRRDPAGRPPGDLHRPEPLTRFGRAGSTPATTKSQDDRPPRLLPEDPHTAFPDDQIDRSARPRRRARPDGCPHGGAGLRRRPAAPRRTAAGLHPRPGLHLDRLLRRRECGAGFGGGGGAFTDATYGTVTPRAA